MGYGGADTSGGNRGNSGSGGAFTGNGLQTGKTWYGNKAHFQGGLQGFSSNGGNFRTPSGQMANSNFQPTGLRGLPSPGGFVQPVSSQPLPPPPPAAVPAPVPPPAPPPAPPAPPQPPMTLPPGYYPGNYMPNPTSYPQHTQTVPGNPNAVQGTYSPRPPGQNVPQNNQGGFPGYGDGRRGSGGGYGGGGYGGW